MASHTVLPILALVLIFLLHCSLFHLLALGHAVSAIINFGLSSFTYIHDHWIDLVTAALINSVVQAFVRYVWSFQPGHLLYCSPISSSGIHGAILYSTSHNYEQSHSFACWAPSIGPTSLSILDTEFDSLSLSHVNVNHAKPRVIASLTGTKGEFLP